MKNSQKWALILFSIGVFMAALDNGIITSALTTIIYSFKITATWGAWSITLYTLGLAISVPVIGKLSDRFGRKRLFLIEISIFAIGSLLVASSQNFTMFLISRFIQSMGGGGIFIIASSYVLSMFPKEKQGRALGMLGGMNGIAAVLGPNIGSFILNVTGSWHWLFLINVPIAIILFILGFSSITETKEPTQARMDFVGIFVLALSVLSLMYALTNLDGVNLIKSIVKPQFYGFFIIGIILVVVLFFIERNLHRRGQDPVLPVDLLSNSTYRWTLLIAFFSGAILASIIFIPAYVEQFLGVSSENAGYWFTPLALASGVGAGGGGALVDRKGPIFTLIIASVLSIAGFLLFPLWVVHTWQMIIASIITGIGFGIMLGAPINILATEKTKEEKGVALGTMSLIRQIGMTIFPTIYAGFLARSFMGLGDKINTNLQKAGIDPSQMPAHAIPASGQMDVQKLVAQVNNIPVPKVKAAILQAIHDVVAHGFNSLFFTSAIVSALTLVTVLILNKVRKEKESTPNVS